MAPRFIVSPQYPVALRALLSLLSFLSCCGGATGSVCRFFPFQNLRVLQTHALRVIISGEAPDRHRWVRDTGYAFPEGAVPGGPCGCKGTGRDRSPSGADGECGVYGSPMSFRESRGRWPSLLRGERVLLGPVEPLPPRPLLQRAARRVSASSLGPHAQ